MEIKYVYEAPAAKVIVVKSTRMICESPNNSVMRGSYGDAEEI